MIGIARIDAITIGSRQAYVATDRGWFEFAEIVFDTPITRTQFNLIDSIISADTDFVGSDSTDGIFTVNVTGQWIHCCRGIVVYFNYLVYSGR